MVVKVNTKDLPALSQRFQIHSIPMTMVFSRGRVVGSASQARAGLVELLNKDVGAEQPKLYVPDIKFRRGIGEYKGQRFSVTGETLDEDAYARYLEEVLPTEKDREALQTITREPDWIAAN